MKNAELYGILEGIRGGGLLRPEDVVEYARPEDSPIHDRFEWDDSVAAEAHRLAQASALIRVVLYVPKEAAVEIHAEVRAYHSLPQDRVHGDGYRVITEVMSSENLRAQLADEMVRQAKAWQDRAAALGVVFKTTAIEKAAKLIRGASPGGTHPHHAARPEQHLNA